MLRACSWLRKWHDAPDRMLRAGLDVTTLGNRGDGGGVYRPDAQSTVVC